MIDSILLYLVFASVLFVGAYLFSFVLSYSYQKESKSSQNIFFERYLNLLGSYAKVEMSWQVYGLSVILFNIFGIAILYLILRFQDLLPMNGSGFGSIAPDSAFNIAMSFGTNTNWQSYGGESTLSNFSQMLGLSVQNFLSAGTGICVLFALTRGFTGAKSLTIGNFWQDISKVTLVVLLPISLLFSLVLMSEGVVQTFSDSVTISSLEDTSKTVKLPLGPVASQIAIKQLGTNGGGFYNVNSAHPFENPTPFTNFLEILAILLIPASCCFFFGREVGNRREGYVLFAAMILIFSMALFCALPHEQSGNPLFSKSIDQSAGNMEGKEVRFGSFSSVLFAVATTSASNGSVNSMHDSFMPITGLVCMAMMQLGEVIFGGVGSGLYGMLAFAITAVFIAGLMVGRTPEYLGKKIGAFDIKMVCLVVLIPCMVSLGGTAWGILIPNAESSITNPGPHGLSQLLYAYSSMGNNNGSAFGGFGANNPYHNFAGGIIMFISRYWLIIPILALAGSLAKKKIIPKSVGTLPTDSISFLILLIFVVLLVGALSFFPVLALGPLAEYLLIGGVL